MTARAGVGCMFSSTSSIWVAEAEDSWEVGGGLGY